MQQYQITTLFVLRSPFLALRENFFVVHFELAVIFASANSKELKEKRKADAAGVTYTNTAINLLFSLVHLVAGYLD